MMYVGSIMSFLIRAQDTDGRFAMVEYRARPGNEPPPHVHLWEHEMYFVLEGKIEFHCGDDRFGQRPCIQSRARSADGGVIVAAGV
jgi:quercetin dioxygenase-like cupin family protein